MYIYPLLNCLWEPPKFGFGELPFAISHFYMEQTKITFGYVGVYGYTSMYIYIHYVLYLN